MNRPQSATSSTVPAGRAALPPVGHLDGHARRPFSVEGIPDGSLELRTSARSSRLKLRVNSSSRIIEVIVPPGLPENVVRQFVVRNAAWVRSRLAGMPEQNRFADGMKVPVLDAVMTIRHVAGLRGGTRREGDEILVGGDPEFLNRRVRDFLIAEARTELARRSREKAAAIGKRVAGVTVKDTTSQWGSCSSDAQLVYSWRLILAPDSVLDYVVAHEVAHLREMNHGPAFWGICSSLCQGMTRSREWLKANGKKLHAFG